MEFTQELSCWSYKTPYFKLTYTNNRVHKYRSIRGVLTNTPHVLRQLRQMGIPNGSDGHLSAKLLQILDIMFGGKSEHKNVKSWEYDEDFEEVFILNSNGDYVGYPLEYFETTENYLLLKEISEKEIVYGSESADIAKGVAELVKVRVKSMEMADEMKIAELLFEDDGDDGYISEEAGVEFMVD